MSDHDDDLSAFRDDPLVHALTGPPSADELAGEAEMLAGFRAATSARTRRRALGRLGVGGVTLGVAVALSGGVAAAYTASLPAPVQQFAHDITTWLGPVKVPAAHHPKPTHTQVADHSSSIVASPPQSLPPVATSSPARQPGHPKPATPHHSHAAAHPRHPKAKLTTSPKPAVTPTPTVTPTPSATPTPTQTATPEPGSITISLSNTTAAPGSTVTAYGRLATSSGDPVPDQDVWLLEHEPGQTSVSEVDSGTTGADGSVALQTGALTHNVRLRLVTRGKVRSAWIAVVLQPTVTASVSSAGTSSTIRVSTDGAQPGDMVDIQRHVPGGWQDVAANQLDSTGGATFGVTRPRRRADHYRAILYRTADHGYASTRFVVPPQ